MTSVSDTAPEMTARRSTRLGLVIDRGRSHFGGLWAALITAGAGLVLMAVVLLSETISGGANATLMASFGITAIMVVGYQIFVGNTGIVSFGHPAFVAIGAYTAGVVSIPVQMKGVLLPDLPGWLAMFDVAPFWAIVIAGLAAGLIAAIIGPVVLLLNGAAGSIMTFGLLVISNEVVRNATGITKGNQTFFGVPKSVEVVHVFIVLAIIMGIAVLFKFSRFGQRARAVFEDPLAAEINGINVMHARFWPWVLSAFVSGIAGALLALNLTAFSASSFYISLVIPVMLMAVLGGMRSVAGAVLGAVIITIWQEFMRGVEGNEVFGLFTMPFAVSDLILGIALVLVLLYRPGGLMNDHELGLKVPAGHHKSKS